MKPPEVAPLQIALLSDPADRSRVEALVRELRGRGLQVGWDGDASIPSSWTDPLEAIQSARIVCVPLSRNSVASERVVRVLETNFGPGRGSLALILDASVRADLARRSPSWELVAFESAEALASVAGYLQSSLTAFESQQTTGTPSADNTVRSRVVIGDSDKAIDAALSSELIQLLVSAAALSPSSQSNRFPVSFSRLFSALFYGGAWQQWCQGIAQSLGFNTSQLVPIAISSSAPAFPLRASISAGRILESARGYAQRSNKPIDVHHVIAAYCFDPAGHERQLDAWSFDRVSWGNALVDEVARRFPQEDEVFRDLRDQTFPAPPPSNAETAEDNVGGQQKTSAPPRYQAWSRPHIDNDRVGGAIPQDKDLLDARKPALRFAKLLVAKDVAPPIALGLFGNWGSGKTFFMGLMRDRIEDLSKSGGAQYVRGVAQIEFNAWHYHDTNLWASLALRIFEGLAEKLGGKKDSDVEKTRKQLHSKINSSDARRKEADALRKKALGRRADAASALEKLRSGRETLRARSARAKAQALWTVVEQGDAFEELRSASVGLAKHFGIARAYASADQLRQLKRDVEDTRSRGFGVLAAIGRRFHNLRDGLTTVGALLVFLCIAVALGWGVSALERLRGIEFPAFTATIVQVSTLVTTVVAWCGRRVRELRVALERIEAIEGDLQAAESKHKPDSRIGRLERAMATLDREIHAKTEEVSAAEHEIAEATAEIDRINRGGLVYDFLQDRRAAANYVGQLGLISTIRQDFEKLDVLLRDFAANAAEDTPPIERIVLYVDDLDRCHPDKVVEVLQAVHLLLAFPLFNVVVGVDARWLERSLRRQYVGQTGGARAQAEDPFSPQDYLEKIFQIPYALSRMDQRGFASLISGMIETRSEWQAKQTAREAGEAPTGKRPQPELSNTGDSSSDATKKSTSNGESTTDQLSQLQGESNKTTPAVESDASTQTSSADALYFEDYEQQFIEQLYEFIDRPRLAKRFINIYRLLRVRADDEGEGEAFLDASTGAYRAALVLLAIHVGRPNVAAKFVQALRRSGADQTWRQLAAHLSEPSNPIVECTPRERAEIDDVLAKLASCDVPEELDAFRTWAPRVACYSFDWHRPEALVQRAPR